MLLSAYYVPGAALSAGNRAVNNKIYAFMAFLLGLKATLPHTRNVIIDPYLTWNYNTHLDECWCRLKRTSHVEHQVLYLVCSRHS